MGDLEVIGAHFGLQEVRLTSHTVDVEVHDELRKELVVHESSDCIFLEQCPHLVLLEIATKLI